MHPEYTQLSIIFGFVICINIVKQIGRTRRDRLWHETARLAIEKGQPLPPPPSRGPFDGRRLWDRGLQGALILIAVGVGLYIALPASVRIWGVLPGFIGIAMLIHFFLAGRDAGRDPSGSDSNDRLP
jgi:hypothetical protein